MVSLIGIVGGIRRVASRAVAFSGAFLPRRAFASASQASSSSSRTASFGAAAAATAAFNTFTSRQILSHIAPTFGLSLATIVGVNLLGFTITAFTRTHLITDLIGTGAFILSASATFFASTSPTHNPPLRSVLLTITTVIWGIRLGSYLFYRILHTKHDSRLASLFPPTPDSPWTTDRLLKLAMFWTLQSAWSFIVLLPVTACHALPISWHLAHPVGLPAVFFLWVWSAGFVLETAADAQKFAFRSDPANDGRFISSGVFSLCRYPNYAGEIALWWGVFGMSLPVFFTKWGFVIALSPVFTTVLIRYVSGVPLLEKRYDAVYRNDEEYQQYKRTTNMLVPAVFKFMPFAPEEQQVEEHEEEVESEEGTQGRGGAGAATKGTSENDSLVGKSKK